MLHPNPEPPGAPELPGDVIAAHDAEDLATELAVDHRPPRDEAEAEPITMLPNRASSVVAVSRSVTWYLPVDAVDGDGNAVDLPAVEDDAAELAFLLAFCWRPVALMISLRSPSTRRIGSVCSLTNHTPG